MPAPKTDAAPKAADSTPSTVEVTLTDAKPGTHTIFHGGAAINFVNGVATVLETVANELRALGQVK